MNRALVAGGLGGATGAVLGQTLAHDSEDYLADELNSIGAEYRSLPPSTQEATRLITSQPPAIREMLNHVLAGAPADQVIAAVPGLTAEQKKLVQAAGELRANAPNESGLVLAMTSKIDGYEKSLAASGLNGGDVAQAAHAGTAGVSAIPAILGAAGLGSGAALLSEVMRRRGGQ